MRKCVPVAILLLNSAFGIARQSVATKDANAVAIIQQSLAAMGGAASFVDVQAVGTTTLYGDEGSVTYPITIQATGTTSIRTSIDKPSGTRVYVTDGTAACVDGALAVSTADTQVGLLARRIDFVPALTILREYAQPNVQVQYVGTDIVNGAPVDVVALSLMPPALLAADQKGYQTAAQRLFFIDRVTSLVDKIQFTTVTDAVRLEGPKTEVILAKYQSFTGFAVPMYQETYVDGKLGQELALASVAFTTGLDGSLFAMSCEVSSGK